jgi:hypothetical protein
MVRHGSERVSAGEQILVRANEVIDTAETYRTDIVEACVVAFRSVAAVFEEERRATDQCAKLGAMLPVEFREARGIFLRDLAAR